MKYKTLRTKKETIIIGGFTMCLAVPGKVLSLDGFKGVIEIGSIRREVFMHLIPDAKIGQYVLVHAGCGIETIDEEEAEKTLELIKELSDNEIC
ncbi:hydrogenase assembly chaperone hypC/hupF [Clostridium sp. DL-VIII]|nr:hydrogenase assembly chaperone hypC/hupF [Clostridium sp. DL-VIII]